MLLQRIITGIILAATSLAAIFYLNEMQFAVFIGIFTTLAAWEWSRLAGWEKLWQQILYAIAIIAGTPIMLLGLTIGITIISIFFGLFGAVIVFPFLSKMLFYNGLFFLNAMFWLVALIIIIAYQYDKNYLPRGRKTKSFIGYLMLIPAWISLYLLRKIGLECLLILLGLIWIADIGAFFVGRTFGKHKLADKVSPGKTIEGALGALLFSGILAITFAYWKSDTVMLSTNGFIAFVALAIITVIFSIVGDLFESLFKRQMGMKDSSQLLPGHGGFLDRLDSIIAAAPIFLMGLYLLQVAGLISLQGFSVV